MNDEQTSAPLKRWGAYLAKAAILLALLYVASLLVPMMPAWGVAVTWALFSLVAATGMAYHVVIDKTFNQRKFQEGVAGFTVTRVVFFVFVFVFSAFCSGCLVLESPVWGLPMWATVVLAVPLYIGVSLLTSRVVGKLYKPLFLESRVALVSALVTAVLLFAVFALLTFLQPAVSYSCAADAFLAAPKPFDSSPSALMREAGEISALAGGLTSYVLARASESSYTGYVIWLAVIEFGALSGVAGFLAVCSIRPGELKRVFQRLGDSDDGESERPVLKSYVAVSAILPLLLVAGFVHLDSRAAEVMATEGFSRAQEFVKQQVSLVVYELDGKYYNPDVVDVLLEEARAESARIAAEAEEELVPLINASFDKRIENVDSYLDWYYSLFGDWEQLVNMVTGDAEEFAKQKLEEHIEQGIDDSELNALFEYYLGQAEDLQAATMGELSQYELTEEYPEWLVAEVKPLDATLSASLEPSQQFLSANDRIGISLVAGAVAAVIAKKLVAKIATKSVFKAVTSRLGGLVAASASASALGPEVAVAAAVASLGVDILLQKTDELLNRDAYREELVATINEQREEMLEAVRSANRFADAA